MSKITLNIIEHGNPAPVDPSGGSVNTGLFTYGIGAPEAAIIVSTILVLTIVGMVLATYIFRKCKKASKTSKLINIAEQTKATRKSKKHIATSLVAISLLISTVAFIALTKNSVNATDTDNQTGDETGLTVNASDIELTIESGDEPVFATIPMEPTIVEATEAGYILTAFTDYTNLISTTAESNIIPMVAVDEDELAKLDINTYGLALGDEPTTKDQIAYISLSTNQENPTLITETNYEETSANDATAIYFGFYIAPDTPSGTYVSADINFEAKPHYLTHLSFNGNGSDGGTEMNGATLIAGDSITLPANIYTKDGYYFTGWNTSPEGTGNPYADEAEFTASSNRSEDVTLYAQWEEDCDANSICYRPNGANNGQNDPKMGSQTTNYSNNTNAITSNMAVNLWPSNYKYDIDNDGYNDYGFAGWSKDKNAASKILDTDLDNDPTVYGPSQNITLGDVSTRGLNLYAVWLPVAKSSTNTNLTFQTANLLTTQLSDGSTLASKPNGYATALKDQRDNQVYAVAKLADGNYWMIENLRLESSATVGNNINDPSVTNESLAEGYGGAFVGLANVESANFEKISTANSLYNTDIIAGNNQDYRFPRYNNDNTTAPVANMTEYNNNVNVYSFGNYYTWSAAIANTDDYPSKYEHSNVATSICPAGWHLPYGGNGTSGTNIGNTSGGFYYLGDKIGGNSEDEDSSKAWRAFPNNIIHSGGYYKSETRYKALGSSYWTNSAYGSGGSNRIDAFRLDVSTVAYVTGNMQKYFGSSVRCVIQTQ